MSEHNPIQSETPDRKVPARQRSRPTARIGLTAHGLLGVLYLSSGLLAPFWTAALLWTVWTGLLALAIQQRYRRPGLVALVPLVDIAVWVLGIWANATLTN